MSRRKVTPLAALFTALTTVATAATPRRRSQHSKRAAFAVVRHAPSARLCYRYRRISFAAIQT
jgi:hypothetical protein